MKREFGRKLIEEVLPRWHLTRVIDTAGACIPGHGTPTVLLFGRREAPSELPVQAVLGIRGEPTTPKNAAEGRVWSSIRGNYRTVGFENEYITVAEMSRQHFAKFPWVIAGGGAIELKELLEARAVALVEAKVSAIGFASFSGEDDVFIAKRGTWSRCGVDANWIRPLVKGENIRDWGIQDDEEALCPYDQASHEPRWPDDNEFTRHLWRYRTLLGRTRGFGGKTKSSSGTNWWEWFRWNPERYRGTPPLTYAYVATHNHSSPGAAGQVFRGGASAPIIKHSDSASVATNLALLAYLSSSIACFYLKMICHNKGKGGGTRVQAGHSPMGENWENNYEFSGSNVGRLCLPNLGPEYSEFARRILECANARADCRPRSFALRMPPTRESLRQCRDRYDQLSRCMFALQEELDWRVYRAFGLPSVVDDSVLGDSEDVPQELIPNMRAFEIAHAHRVMAGVETGRWFEYHGRALVSDAKTCGVVTQGQIDVIERRLATIRDCREIRALELPEYKRPWKPINWDAEVQLACREWLMNHVEAELLKFSRNRPVEVRVLAQRLEGHSAIQEVAECYTGEASPDLERTFAALIGNDVVPYVAGHRHTEAGLRKRASWERTWELQRREDAGEPIDVPGAPKYAQGDFSRSDYWRHRGKLDVPKERFISYPNLTTSEEQSPLVGWAGWDALQRAEALADLYHRRRKEDGWTTECTPILAGLLELVPWLKQWHNEPDARFGGKRLGDFYGRYVESQARELGLTLDDLRSWRPETKARGARKKTAKKATRKPKLSADQLIEAVGATAGAEGAALAALAEHTGASKPAISKLAAALVDNCKLVQTSARPKRFALAKAGTDEQQD